MFAQNFVKSVNKYLPGFLHRCPYQGLVGVYGVNPEDMVNLIFPQILPAGIYKLVVRIHTRKNVSIADIAFTNLIDAKDIMKRVDIGSRPTVFV